MAEIQYTASQKDAISYRGGNVLVSAAAGSGKTSVLSQRVCELVKEGQDIRRMLIVTFTQKASQEMRKRIRKTLSEAAENENRPQLAIQAEMTDSSDICTIHSFAGKVLRENFSVLGLPSDIHAVSDETIGVYRSEAYDELFERLYQEEDPSFLRFRDRYSGRDEKELVSIIEKAYNFVRSQPEGVEWIRKNRGLDREKYISIAREKTRNQLLLLQSMLEDSLELSINESFPEKQISNDMLDKRFAEDLIRLFDEGSYEQYMKLLQSYKIPAIFRVKKGEEVPPEKETLSEMKKKARDLLRDLASSDINEIGNMIDAELPYINETVDDLYHILSAYDEQYSAIKMEHHAFDYDDMLHFAYKALSDDMIASRYSSFYDHVFIDEYQDTNPLQEALLNRIEPSGGRFMVGDMKQSIYRFRLTDPTIFRSKTQNGGSIHLIKMNENFRCDGQIIDFINHVMSNLMGPELGEIVYDDEERLIGTGDRDKDSVELMLTAVPKKNAVMSTELEAVNIAGRIKDLLQERDENGERRYREEDICILMRSLENYAPRYAYIMQKEGIDVRLSSAEDDHLANDIFLNLLRVIDGFTSDIALLSVMKSFIGDFDENDFAQIRGASKDDSFSSAFLRYCEQNDTLAGKCRSFYRKIDMYRKWARTMALEDLLIRLKNAEDFDANIYMMVNGTDKENAFNTFFGSVMDAARDKSSLYELLYYMDRINRSYEKKSTKKESLGAVQLMSIHSAKGLEFPVVIIARMDSGFSTADSRNRFFMHNDLGISMDMVDEVNRVKKNSVVRELGDYAQKKEQLSEELRVLYVAMTRAKKKLILSGSTDDVSKILNRSVHSWYDYFRMGSFMEWILSATKDLKCMNDWTHRIGGSEDVEIPHYFAGYCPEDEIDESESLNETILKDMSGQEGLEFSSYRSYRMPVTIGVSSLLPQDEYGNYVPSYRDYRDIEDGGAELGTIIHHFMEHIDFTIDSEDKLEKHAMELIDKRIMFEDEMDRVRPFYSRIMSFLRSGIADEIRRSPEVLREVQFSLSVKARDIGQGNNDEKIILHGIIDLAYRIGNEYVVVDYKSNMVDDQTMEKLAQHYFVQMKMYRMALERIKKLKVRNCYLWFIRSEREFQVY